MYAGIGQFICVTYLQRDIWTGNESILIFEGNNNVVMCYLTFSMLVG